MSALPEAVGTTLFVLIPMLILLAADFHRRGMARVRRYSRRVPDNVVPFRRPAKTRRRPPGDPAA